MVAGRQQLLPSRLVLLSEGKALNSLKISLAATSMHFHKRHLKKKSTSLPTKDIVCWK